MQVLRYATKVGRNPSLVARVAKKVSIPVSSNWCALYTQNRSISSKKHSEKHTNESNSDAYKFIKDTLGKVSSISSEIEKLLVSQDVVEGFNQSEMSTIIRLLDKTAFDGSDKKAMFTNLLICCCNNRDYLNGYSVITKAASYGVLLDLPTSGYESIMMLLYKYHQYRRILSLYEMLSTNQIPISQNVMLSVIRSYGNNKEVEKGIAIMNKEVEALSSRTEESLLSQQFKFYSAGMEVYCMNHQENEAVLLLQKMAEMGSGITCLPRNSYLYLFNHISSLNATWGDRYEILSRINTICMSSGCAKDEVTNHFIYALMKCGYIKQAKEAVLSPGQQSCLNDQAYTYLLMGLNHYVKNHGKNEDIEEKAQTLSLAMLLMHKYRRVDHPEADFYIQLIMLLGHYHEYDKLDIVIQGMNKDRIPFDGRIYSALIDAFEDTQLVIDIYNDAKNNLPESDPYASTLFPRDSFPQEYAQFPKIIDCCSLRKSACKTTLLRELSSMDINDLESIHDLILITDYHSPAKNIYSTVTSLLNSMNLYWFQGDHDGRIYITRDSIIDYLTIIDENKRIHGFKRLVTLRSKWIPVILILV